VCTRCRQCKLRHIRFSLKFVNVVLVIGKLQFNLLLWLPSPFESRKSESESEPNPACLESSPIPTFRDSSPSPHLWKLINYDCFNNLCDRQLLNRGVLGWVISILMCTIMIDNRNESDLKKNFPTKVIKSPNHTILSAVTRFDIRQESFVKRSSYRRTVLTNRTLCV